MPYLMLLSLCILGAACSGSLPDSPTAPSSPAAIRSAPSGAKSDNAPIEVSFTKWVTTSPHMAGFTSEGGDPGTYVGEILSRIPSDNGVLVDLDARYQVINASGHSFTAVIHGKTNNQTSHATLNGVVTEGWAVGAQVHVTFDVISPCSFGTRNVCFQGTIRVMPGSAD